MTAPFCWPTEGMNGCDRFRFTQSGVRIQPVKLLNCEGPLLFSAALIWEMPPDARNPSQAKASNAAKSDQSRIFSAAKQAQNGDPFQLRLSCQTAQAPFRHPWPTP